jgi:predicted permease
MLPLRWFYTFPLRFRSLFRSKNVEQELHDELQFHIDRHAEKQIARGLPPEEARREARRAMGGVAQRKEECRDMRKTQPVEIVWRDVRYGVRSLRSRPLFTITAILSLALGIGANTAVFTLMHAILWKPLPVREPDQIVQLMRTSSADPAGLSGGYSWYFYQQLIENAQPYGELAAKAAASRRKFGLSIDSPERVTGEAVSANYFRALRVEALGGRVFGPEDENVLGGARVAILSHAFWAARFQSDPSILGKTIYYDETPYAVVGVTEPGFAGVQSGTAIDVWVPVTAAAPASQLKSKSDGFLTIFARLNASAGMGPAQGAWNGRFRAYVARDLLPRYPPRDRFRLESERIVLRPARSGLAGALQQYRKAIYLLMGIVMLVLLICCANVTNLVLARNAARRQEIGVRLALGASRGRVTSQLLIESLLIALAGATAGIALAAVAAKGLIAMLPRSSTPLALDSRPDGAVLGFTIGVASMTALLFGLLPALRASRTDVDAKLKTGVRVTGRSFTGRALVASQLALSLVLLIAGGLFLGTIRNLKATNLGFRPDSVAGFDVSFPRGTAAAEIRRVYERIRDNLKNAPGVISASHVWPSVYSRERWRRGVAVEGRPFLPDQRDFACGVSVGPEFFETMGMVLVAGRYLDERDQTNAAAAIVVNQSFVSAYLAGASPLGRHVIVDGAPSQNWEIVGVVRDAKHYGVRESICRTTYVPAAQAPQWNAYSAQGLGSLLVRSSTDFRSAATVVRAAISTAGGGVQIEGLQPLEMIVDDMVNQEHMIAVLSGAFAVLALVLAAVGLYGVMAYGVSQRTSELGIRMALGAGPGDLQWLVLRETAQLILVGVTVGIAAALLLTRLTSNLLYGVKPTDAMIFGASALLLTAVAVLAGHLPARRASRIDPMVALRHE